MRLLLFDFVFFFSPLLLKEYSVCVCVCVYFLIRSATNIHRGCHVKSNPAVQLDCPPVNNTSFANRENVLKCRSLQLLWKDSSSSDFFSPRSNHWRWTLLNRVERVKKTTSTWMDTAAWTIGCWRGPSDIHRWKVEWQKRKKHRVCVWSICLSLCVYVWEQERKREGDVIDRLTSSLC